MRRLLLTLLPLLLILVWMGAEVPAALAQDEGVAPADSLETETETPSASGGLQGASQEAQRGGGKKVMGRDDRGTQASGAEAFFKSFTNSPKFGIQTNATSNAYYGEFSSLLNMREGARMSHDLKYRWSDFRQQIKTTESRTLQSSYSSGTQLPVSVTVNGGRDWNEDLTTNSSGDQNVSRRDNTRASLGLNLAKATWRDLNFSIKSSSGLTDNKSINQGQRNDLSEAFLDGGMKVGRQVAEGVSVAGRVFGRTASGDRTLGEFTSNSSASTDSLGFGVYYDRNITSGRVALTRGNFERRYLDYRRNANGIIDTSGVDPDEKVVDEIEFKDSVTMELVNNTRLLGITFDTELSHTTDESDFAIANEGFKERLQQEAEFAMGFEALGDTFNIAYSYLWKWDDQQKKTQVSRRGRQYTKERDLKFYWKHTLFKATELTFRYGSNLSQNTAENGYLDTDKDRLRNDYALRLDRSWSDVFTTDALFSYNENQDIRLTATTSGNNNVKDSYEIAPGYRWIVSDRVEVRQKYRVYIQYTDYIYSELESSSRVDDYNKRGNLTTTVDIEASDRLNLTVRHDFNKRFNADKTVVDAAGNAGYFVNQRQRINKIDLSFTFDVAQGILLEGSTYSTLDEKTSITNVERVTEQREGKIWVGAKVNKKWGANEDIELSALVRKHSGYGPSLSEANANFWETDVWFKWSF